MAVRILHFADAHIDIANYGRHDAQSGLPVRVLDFLRSLDTIVDAAIAEKVDLVLFAGDAFKDRTPAPTFQREWGRRIMRLSKAGIPALLLVGNHDLSPALGRAHALDSFETLEVPRVLVIDRPRFLSREDLRRLGVQADVQIIALPWVSPSRLAVHLSQQDDVPVKLYENVAARLGELVEVYLREQADPTLPTVLTAHCSVEGAQYGAERTVMLGQDLTLPPSLLKDPRLDYVALGHIHKAQDLNTGGHPPVVYPGSIERVDFGEAGQEKFFVIAQVARGETQVEWRRLQALRPFFDIFLRLKDEQDIPGQIQAALPPPAEMDGAILRLILEYPRQWEALIDEAALRQATSTCFEFHLVKRARVERRSRLPGDSSLGALTPLELLDLYWKAAHQEDHLDELNRLAAEIIREVEEGSEPGAGA